jgi:hypothetical protein
MQSATVIGLSLSPVRILAGKSLPQRAPTPWGYVRRIGSGREGGGQGLGNTPVCPIVPEHHPVHVTD